MVHGVVTLLAFGFANAEGSSQQCMERMMVNKKHLPVQRVISSAVGFYFNEVAAMILAEDPS